MMRIVALNEESEDDSNSEEEVTREALEEIALQEYAKAIDLQRKGSLKEALQLLQDLLDTELLYEVKKAEPGKQPNQLYHLKYLCHKNIASILNQLDRKEEAIEAYFEACILDGTDVTLWNKLGNICLQSEKFELALQSFQRGVDCNPRHWPCLDKIITLLFGLSQFNECIMAIYDTLDLDSDYLRALVYRKYIYTNYPYVLDYMCLINPIYNWKPEDDPDFDKKDGEKLVKEAIRIKEKYAEQLKKNSFIPINPELVLKKPISDLTWLSVGESLVHMHNYMTDNLISHACVLEITFHKKTVDEKMETEVISLSESSEPNQKSESNPEIEKNDMSASECEMNEQSDKNVTDNEKAESDTDNAQQEGPKSGNEEKESKETKKAPVRRRGSDLSFLQQWEWCTKRRSSRKKPITMQDCGDETVLDTLRRLLPSSFMLKSNNKDKKSDITETSSDTMDLYKLFEAKEKDLVASEPQKNELKEEIICNYFGSTEEENNVQEYINKYMESKCDIITLLRDYLHTLTFRWKEKWPNKLPETFVKANNCLNNHIDRPCYFNSEFDELKFYGDINMCALEIELDEKCHSKAENKDVMNTEVVDLLGFYLGRPQIYGEDCLVFTLRYLWIKAHAALHNEQVETAFDALYQLLHEFNALGGEYEDVFSVEVPNFTYKPHVSKYDVKEILKSLERNMLLSTVMELYRKDNLEQVLTILLDSFKPCRELAHRQEYEEISLDWAVQLSLLIDVHWALGNVKDCFTWATISLEECLKHYLLCTQGSHDYDKWTLAIIKALVCIEHIIKQEGIYYLDVLEESQLNRLVQSLVEIIGHQCDESGSTEMPLNTVTPWIILHYVLQREEDQGKIKIKQTEGNEIHELDNIPSSLMILFQAHEYLGRKSWCCNGEGQLLYFILDNLIPRIRSPIFVSCLETITQYLEQCVFCLFGHPSKKTKLRYLIDHNVNPFKLDWERAQQIYEIFKPFNLPELDSHKAASISAETEQLLLRMLALLPQEYNPKSYRDDILSYIEGKTVTLPETSNQMPYKTRDIYYLLADYYFKNKEYQKFLKYNIYDIIVNKNRFDSWAAMGLTRGSFLETKLNSCETIKSDMDYLTKAAVVERCFKKSLEIDSTHATLWIEYGCFVYYVHSFCSRLLKQASESLSMDDFEALEQRKETMLDTAHKCFIAANKESDGFEYEDQSNDERWLHYYILGKISEKKSESPGVYLNFYIKAGKYLQENKATYPSKINYNAPQNLSIEALEIHYRMNASILKFIEQHESKPISVVEGKAFQDCLSYCMSSPFSRKKLKHENTDSDTNAKEENPNTLKRSISDAGDDYINLNKKVKLDNCGKLRRSVSYDTDRNKNTEALDCENKDDTKVVSDTNTDLSKISQDDKLCHDKITEIENDISVKTSSVNKVQATESADHNIKKEATTRELQKVPEVDSENKKAKPVGSPSHDSASTHTTTTRGTTSDSSSNSSSDDSSSESSSDSSDTSCSKASAVKPPIYMSQGDIDNIIATCLDNLEDCVSRLPQHYKALYRLAHYHFYYKRGKDIERCRDLMLASFTSRNGQKLQGLFSERKNSNFFNGIWRIPVSDIDRAGSFASHMSRCVLLSMDILKEIDDHKTLLDLSLQLHRVPDPDKKYLRDSEREELSQQAFSLCVQSLKGQLTKFSHQSDLKSNEVERKALSSLMLDIYRAHQKALKHMSAKPFANLLIEGYKLSINTSSSESTNLLEASLKYCQNLVFGLKQQATMNMNLQGHTSAVNQSAKKPTPKFTTDVSPKPITIPASSFLPQVDATSSMNLKIPSLPTSDAITNSLLNSYLPMLADHSLFAPQSAAAAALTYMSNLGNYSNYQSLQNSYQKEFSRQYMNSLYSTSYMPNIPQQAKSKQSANKVGKNMSQVSKQGSSTSSATSVTSARSLLGKNKSPQQTSQSLILSSTSDILTPHMNPPLSATNVSASLATSNNTATFGTTVQPAHMGSSTTPTFTLNTGVVKPAHMSTTSTMAAALQTKPPPQHQQVSPGKTLQEKLAEKQKLNPNIPKIQNLSEVNASITSKLPSALTVTKTGSINKDKLAPKDKPPEVRRAVQSDKEQLAKAKTPISSSEVIVLDDDD